MALGSLYVARGIRRGENHHSRLAAPLAGAEPAHNLVAIAFGELKVQKQQARTPKGRVGIDAIEKCDGLLAIGNHLEFAVYRPVFQCLSH